MAYSFKLPDIGEGPGTAALRPAGLRLVPAPTTVNATGPHEVD